VKPISCNENESTTTRRTQQVEICTWQLARSQIRSEKYEISS